MLRYRVPLALFWYEKKKLLKYDSVGLRNVVISDNKENTLASCEYPLVACSFNECSRGKCPLQLQVSSYTVYRDAHLKTKGPIFIDIDITNRCRDCLILISNIWVYVPLKTCWSGTQFAYVLAKHFIASKCFQCARERGHFHIFRGS
jgi:hypothetical protein